MEKKILLEQLQQIERGLEETKALLNVLEAEEKKPNGIDKNAIVEMIQDRIEQIAELNKEAIKQL